MSIPGIGLIGRRYRHLKRYRQIASVVLRHGFGDLVGTFGRRRLARIGGRSDRGEKTEDRGVPPTRWERVRLALEELGPSFVKLGQVAGTRPDMVPPDLCAELAKLQDTVRPFPSDEARRIVETELGDVVETLFEHFEETPLASASVAQVHRAVLPDGEIVAVKIQRPGIRQTIEVDLEIMLDLARLMQGHLRGVEAIDPVGIVEEFGRTIRRELDFGIEAGHIELFAANFRSEDTVHVPRVHRALSTRKVLTMEFIEGTKISDLPALRERGYDLEVIASRGADLLLEQIFEHGFFHGDPHPGNILVLPGNVICFLDYGMMGTVRGRHRQGLRDLVVGIVDRDEREVSRALLDLAVGGDPSRAADLEEDVADFMQQHLYRSLRDIRMGRLITQLTVVLVRHHLRIAPDFYLLAKALATSEGNGRRLSPDFDMVQHTEPFVRRILRRRFSPRVVMKDTIRAATDLRDLLQDLPGDLRDIFALIKRGRIHVEFEHKGLDTLFQTLDRVSNRIAFAIVLASLVIGSSLIVLSGIPPYWSGIPAIGILGFLAAGVMGFWLLVSILRHWRM